MTDFFANPNVLFVFEDDIVIPVNHMMPAFQTVFQSFPNLNFSNTGITEIKPGVVMIEEQVCQGTHTGAPFSFAKFPAVPRSDKHVKLDPERVYATIQDGKIVKYEMVSLGSLCGYHGLYLGVGGVMEAPEDDDSCLLYTSPSPRDQRGSRMPSSA